MMIKKYDNVKLTKFITGYITRNITPNKVQMPFNILINGKSFYIDMSYINADKEQNFSYPISGFYLYIEPGYVHKNDNYSITDKNQTACQLIIASDYSSKKYVKLAHASWLKPFIRGISHILVYNYNNNAVQTANYIDNHVKQLQKKNKNIKNVLASLGNVSQAGLWSDTKVHKFLQKYDVNNI